MSNTRVGMMVGGGGGIHCWSEGMALTTMHPVWSCRGNERMRVMPRPKTKALQEAREKLEATREDFAQAFEEVVSKVDLTTVAAALTAWRKAAETFADEARSVYEDASTSFDDRAEKWQDSDKGLAFANWRDELERLADFDGEPTDEVHIGIDLSSETPVAELEGDPSDVLPELPDIPELEE